VASQYFLLGSCSSLELILKYLPSGRWLGRVTNQDGGFFFTPDLAVFELALAVSEDHCLPETARFFSSFF